MITGIDETGNFDPNSKPFNYFVAVHIDQNHNKFLMKQSQFNIWESSVPNKFKTNTGEIKGQRIPEEFLESFYNSILDVKPSVSYSVVRIIPAENPIEIF